MYRAMLLFLGLLAAAPTFAQGRYEADERDSSASAQFVQNELSAPSQPAAISTPQPGRVATSSVGEVGQRRTREESAPGMEPMGRISNRIDNRVQSRIRNRIDRYYDPQANASSPFKVAGEQARKAGRPKRR